MPDWHIAGEDQMAHSGLDRRENQNPNPNAHGKEAASSGLSRAGAGGGLVTVAGGTQALRGL